ncbi:MAG TPA: hemerythrin domain-containing protein [Burkholderiaceae bacterium]|nr:hemerythrin domain-containing protein [Burkholderiaceae bacterium]
MNAIPTPAADDAPVQEFSHCHDSIFAQLTALARLPELARAALQARHVAETSERFMREVVLVHHAEEEQELFPAVLQSARAGAERDKVQALVERLTRDHREVEHAWSQLAPQVHAVARGREGTIDAARLAAFVARYRAHAEHEEKVFLPLASAILGRNGNHMAALGLSLHARHALPEVLRRFGTAL